MAAQTACAPTLVARRLRYPRLVIVNKSIPELIENIVARVAAWATVAALGSTKSIRRKYKAITVHSQIDILRLHAYEAASSQSGV